MTFWLAAAGAAYYFAGADGLILTGCLFVSLLFASVVGALKRKEI